MTEQTDKYNGRIVWHDMMSKDVDASIGFYTSLFGWEVKQVDTGTPPYRMIHADGRPIGGLVPLEGVPAEVPSHWMGYVNTDDIEACVGRSESAGGTTCVPITEIPGMGKFSVLTDPQGAAISAWQSTSDQAHELPEVPPAGTFCWMELHASDPAGAVAFYGETFGWTAREMDMGPAGTYRIFSANGKDVGGAMQLPPDAASPPAWLAYVAVDDVDGMTAKAEELGASPFVEPTDIPGMGRFSVLADPVGATFALFQAAAQA